MDNKITLSVLAQMLSDRTGRSRKECEELLRSFFQTISSTLAAGEAVKVRGFGTFKISQVDARMSVDISSGQDFEIPAHNRIVFLPSKELAGAVNAPFEMFETIELAEDLTDSELQASESESAAGSKLEPESDDEPQTAKESDMVETPTATEPSEPVSEPVSEPDPESAPATVTVDYRKQEPARVEESPSFVPADDTDNSEHSVGADDNEAAEPVVIKSKSHFGHGFIWGMIAAVVIILIGFMACYWMNEDFAGHVDQIRGKKPVAEAIANPGAPAAEAGVKNEGVVTASEVLGDIESGVDGVTEDAVLPEAPAETEDNPVPTKPSDTPVYDTIRPNSGLGVMARKHYGNYHFWPYIYKENEKILGHPDRITPGTRVVIPALSKYGVNPKNPDDLAKAKRLDAEIYARYRKHSGRPK